MKTLGTGIQERITDIHVLDTRIVLCALGYTHAIHVYTQVRYCDWWAGPLIFIQLVVAYHLAESQSLACYTTR